MPESGGPCVGEVRDAMRNWVTAYDGNRHDFQAEGLVRLDIRHNHLEQRWHDLRFCKDSSVFAAKEQLHKHGAGSVAHMELYLRMGNGETVFLYDDNRTLRSFGVDNDMELFVKDCDPYSMAANGGLEDVSQVEKFRMSDEQYDGREKTLRNHIKEKRAADPTYRMFKKEGEEIGEGGPNGDPALHRSKTPENVKGDFPVGARCECNPGGRRGAIGFVGKVGSGGTFIGIALDEPMGLNDGTKDGKTYFECKGPKYGCFAKPENVTVGDFPELDPFADLDEI